MKRYCLLLMVFFALVATVGLSYRGYSGEQETLTMKQPSATAVYEWGEIEIEPFLYAVPLGTFTPYQLTAVYELPNGAVTGEELKAGDPVEFTSEHKSNGNIWLCIAWNVDENVAAWECTGWVLAESEDRKNGAIDRDYEYEPDAGSKEQNA